MRFSGLTLAWLQKAASTLEWMYPAWLHLLQPWLQKKLKE